MLAFILRSTLFQPVSPHPQRLEDHQGHEERVVDQIPPPEAPGFGE